MTHVPITDKDIDRSFLSEVEAKSGQNIHLCYSCGKCSAGCPLAPDMKHLPHQIMLMVLNGLKDKVLDSPTMWVCASCATCTTRCPKEIDINAVMDTLNEMATDLGKNTNPKVKIFRDEFLATVKKHGRMHELSLALRMNLRSGEPFADADMGLKLWRKGKIELKPASAPNKEKWQPLFKKEKS